MASNYRPRSAIVTGAGSGIGRALSMSLANVGAEVHVVGRTADKLDDVAGEITASGGRASTHPLDVTDEEATAEFSASFEQLDVLAHSAAVFRRGPLADAPTPDFDDQFSVNVRAPFIITRQLLPALRNARGQVVFLNSLSGRRVMAEVGLYAASKFALRALADTLRIEENQSGVRILSVYPGKVATPMQEGIYGMTGRAYEPSTLLQPEDVARQILAALSLPPNAAVTDILLEPSPKV